MREKIVTLNIDRPHDKQLEFINSPAKRKVVVAGRRFGKTTGTSMLATLMFLKGRRILQAAPSFEQTDAFWQNVKRYLKQPIEDGYIYKNESLRLLTNPEGGRIKTKTAWNADMLRGDYADLLILEEYSLMSPTTWDEVGSPMLLDNDGDAIFIFTPKRKNHAWKLYQQYQSDGKDRTACWHFTSYDNPHISREALEEIAGDMTQDAYEQEIMAEFLANEGQVFRNIYACLNSPIDQTPEQHKEHEIVMGVDWGKENDYTAISVGCVDCHMEVDNDRFRKIGYTFQRGRIRALASKWNASTIMVELNSIGQPNFEELFNDGLPVTGFKTTGTSKEPLIRDLALSFEKETWQFISDPIWNGELESFEQKVNDVTYRSTYSAPEGLHDDTVIARALMVRAGAGWLWLVS